VRSKDVCALMKLLDLLREQGVTPRRTIEAVPTARETLIEKYRCYLREERDLAYGSVRNMTPFVDRFLAQKYPRDYFDFAALKVGDITSFVRKQATKLGSVQAKHMVSSLRAFFRYLRHRGERKSCGGRFEALPTDGATWFEDSEPWLAYVRAVVSSDDDSHVLPAISAGVATGIATENPMAGILAGGIAALLLAEISKLAGTKEPLHDTPNWLFFRNQRRPLNPLTRPSFRPPSHVQYGCSVPGPGCLFRCQRRNTY
jgi:hypothetical protein